MGSIHQNRKLFTPLQIGDMILSHRIIMSPLTRARCPGGIPSPLVAEYYAQRATPGGMIISEGMHPSFMVSLQPTSLPLTLYLRSSKGGVKERALKRYSRVEICSMSRACTHPSTSEPGKLSRMQFMLKADI